MGTAGTGIDSGGATGGAWPATRGAAATVLSRGQTNDLHQRALEVLRRTMAEQPGATDPAKRNNRTAPVIKEPDFTEIEKQYLEGKISAKQFQKYLQDHKLPPAKAPA